MAKQKRNLSNSKYVKHCEICGEPFYAPPCRIKRKGHSRFCSKPCKGVAMIGQPGTTTKHGMTATPTWKTWDSIKQRVFNPKCKDYPDYGGRGIDIDPRWLEFTNFFADMGERPHRKTIGRVDNSKGYWPDNCRWETCREQNNNRRSSAYVTINNVTKTIAQWARELGTSRQTIRHRVVSGWLPEEIVSPVEPRKPRNKEEKCL